MFATIFKFEMRRWLSNWPFYIYFALFFGLGFIIMAAAAGFFDSLSVTTTSNTYINSPSAINALMNALSQMVFFIIPTVLGATLYRDYKYNVHSILYSYPITKFDYLNGKFWSGFLATALISFSVGLAFFIATLLPFANEALLGPTRIWAYVQSYLLFVLPNIFFVGSILFVLVSLSRNIYVGFIFVIILFILQAILSSFTANMDNRYVAALLDPSGQEALSYVTKYWTVEEQNTNNLPFSGVILLNRLIYIGIGALVFGLYYWSFKFSMVPIALGKPKKSERITKNNFDTIQRVSLSKVFYLYDFKSYLKSAIKLSRYDFRMITRNWIFITLLVIILIFVGMAAYTLGQEIYGTKSLATSWKVTDAIHSSISGFAELIVMLFTGYILQTARINRINLMQDATAVPDWALFGSKLIAIFKVIFMLQLLSFVACITVQLLYGYYAIDWGHYFQVIFVFNWLEMIPLIALSFLVHALVRNYLLGFVALIAVMIIWNQLNKIGVEHSIFHFNSGSYGAYSEMNGFGSVREYYFYKIYWLFFSVICLIFTLLWIDRGVLSSFTSRLKNIGNRLNKPTLSLLLVSTTGLGGLGGAIYYHDTQTEPYYTAQEQELQQVDWEKKYKKYQTYPQPRIVDVYVDMDLEPSKRNYNAKAQYILVNKTQKAIDTLLVNHSDNLVQLSFNLANQHVFNDSILHFRMYRLQQALQPGDTIKMSFEVANRANTWLRDKSPVIENGTFINNMLFPSIGYSEDGEISHHDVREKYGLPPKEIMPDPTDPHAQDNNYISSDADWITFETVVSTDTDQIAIAPGYLIKEWTADNRRYFHYKMDQKIINFFAYNSARYEVKRDKINEVNLEIYYHKGHQANLEHMMNGMKDAIGYYSKAFSPYQHKQARIIEFPASQGTFAQAFANTMPFSEGIGFIADVNPANPDEVNYPYSVTAHEMAHQWWAHQVIGAKAKGATMLSESLSEYSSLKVLEKRHGKLQMRRFLKDALDKYLMGRRNEWKLENPLVRNENQQYIHYNKGSLVMYTMSDLLGEDKFNAVLSNYLQRVRYQEAPYTVATELVDDLRKATPDSLQYLITDLFETITLYDNSLREAKVTELSDGKFQIDLDLWIAKYRSQGKGERIYEDQPNTKLVLETGKTKIESLPLADYIEVAVFADSKVDGKPLYLKRHRFDKIDNRIQLIVDQKPALVILDPYSKLIDMDSEDNEKKL